MNHTTPGGVPMLPGEVQCGGSCVCTGQVSEGLSMWHIKRAILLSGVISTLEEEPGGSEDGEVVGWELPARGEHFSV